MPSQNLTRIATLAAIASASAGATQALGQTSVFAPPPAVSTTPPAFQQLGQGDPMANEADAQLLGWLPKGLPFSYGPLTFRPHLSYSVQYGDGISASPGNREKTTVHQISPGMLINIGQKWVLDYTPTLRYYSSKAFEDGVDHRVSLSGGTEYKDWFLGLSQSYSKSSAPTVETADQNETESFNTSLSAGRQLNTKTSIDLGLSQALSFSSGGYNSHKTWSTTDFINYQFWPKFQGGAGATFSYTDVEVGSDMTSEQPTLRLTYTPATKTTFNIHGGLEVRQFLDSEADDLVNPVFGASISYSPFDHTHLSLSANRSVSASYFNNQVTEGTSVSLGLNQRLLKHLNLGLSGSYSTTDYLATDQGLDVSRSDDRYSFTARLSTAFLKRGSLGLFYTYSKNESNSGVYAYDSNMIGADVSYRW
jgi:hypothetical protein